MKVERVRERMALLEQTQQELALRCEVDLRTLQRWLSGQRVSLESAERVAAALGLGTAELFEGVPANGDQQLAMRVRSALRLLSAREGEFAQALRLAFDTYEEISTAVSLSAHPLHGYVWRFPLGSAFHHGFVPFRVQVPEPASCTLTVRAQIGRRLSYALGRVRVRGAQAELVETFYTRSMLATLSADRMLDLFVWGSPDRRELVLTCDAEVKVSQLDAPISQLFDLAAPEARHAVCFRPGPVHLRSAGLPAGFDRMVGVREARVDVAICS